MAFVCPREGELQILNVVLNKTALENMTLKLFSNNVVPGQTDTAATYTECAGSGYGSIALTGADWTTTIGTASPSTAACAQKTFTLTGALTAYGYFIVGATSGKCYFAEKFSDGPYILPAGGGTIKVTPNANAD